MLQRENKGENNDCKEEIDEREREGGKEEEKEGQEVPTDEERCTNKSVQVKQQNERKDWHVCFILGKKRCKTTMSVVWFFKTEIKHGTN